MKKKLLQTKATKEHIIINSEKFPGRNQKFTIGDCFGGMGAEPQLPQAIGGFGAKPPAAEGKGVWGQSPQRLKILDFFFKNNLILGLF